MKRDFTDWLSTFRDSIATYSYYIDFEKVYGNVENIKIELNILNSLIGSKTIEKDFENIEFEYTIYDNSHDNDGYFCILNIPDINKFLTS